MGFSPDFLDEIRHRVGLADLIGRQTKLTKRGREYVGLCPFHKEKSPSFTVNEDKGFYHCFGCGAHGSAFDFVSNTEGVGFPEAVERLAGQVGLQVPTSSPEERERAERSKTLRDVVEAAAGWFESQLASQPGEEARRYLAGRGVAPEISKRFRVGFAPESKSALKEAMVARGFTEDLLIQAGLLGVPDDGRASYDYFRNRLMFPICDHRGQVIAFGGRTLGEARAKYLNSPETPLFHKGNVLYNLHQVAPQVRDGGSILVVEGYMDVIGLAAAGIGNAVAPLGTALTETQMAILWKKVPEPILCFDGDRAGKSAAYRAAERAIPELKPGYSLCFAMLPEGEDPDSLVRSRGQSAMEELLDRPLDLSDLMWDMLTEGKTFDTPSRRSGLDKDMDQLTRQIQDEKVRGHYSRYLRGRINDLIGSSRPNARSKNEKNWRPDGKYKQKPNQGRGTTEVKNSQIVLGGVNLVPRERALLLAPLNHPEMLTGIEEEFGMIEFLTPALDNLRNEILRIVLENPDLDRETLKRHLKEDGYETLVNRISSSDAGPPEWFTSPSAALQDVKTGWRLVLNRHQQASLRRQLEEARNTFKADESPENWEKFSALLLTVQAAEGDEADLDGFGDASGLEII
jgi:DNA primase